MEMQSANFKTALILAAIALAFFIGTMIRQLL
jgi:hypothetical protein